MLRCVWLFEAARVCTGPFQFLRVCEHTSPFYLFSPTPPLSLSRSVEADEGWGGVGGGQLEHRRLFVWDFFIWFPSSLHTERAHYAIIYFHIQRRDVEGPVGPRSVLSPLLCFILDPFPNRAHPGRKKNPKKE